MTRIPREATQLNNPYGDTPDLDGLWDAWEDGFAAAVAYENHRERKDALHETAENLATVFGPEYEGTVRYRFDGSNHVEYSLTFVRKADR